MAEFVYSGGAARGLASRKTLGDFQRQIGSPVSELRVKVPRNEVIATNAGAVIAADPSRMLLTLQNVGANPIKIAFDVEATSEIFHQILAGGAVARDGLGSISVSGALAQHRLTMFSNAGSEIAVMEAVFPSESYEEPA
jgi:hypothetical protein